MADKNNAGQNNRRTTLMTLLGGAGAVAGASALPKKWSKPLISSVVLPAHAKTTQGECDFRVADFAIEGESEIWVLLENPDLSEELTVEVNIEFADGEGEAQSFSSNREIDELTEGVGINIPTEGFNENEAQISQVFEICVVD